MPSPPCWPLLATRLTPTPNCFRGHDPHHSPHVNEVHGRDRWHGPPRPRDMRRPRPASRPPLATHGQVASRRAPPGHEAHYHAKLRMRPQRAPQPRGHAARGQDHHHGPPRPQDPQRPRPTQRPSSAMPWPRRLAPRPHWPRRLAPRPPWPQGPLPCLSESAATTRSTATRPHGPCRQQHGQYRHRR